jgi:hypothetical protein
MIVFGNSCGADDKRCDYFEVRFIESSGYSTWDNRNIPLCRKLSSEVMIMLDSQNSECLR